MLSEFEMDVWYQDIGPWVTKNDPTITLETKEAMIKAYWSEILPERTETGMEIIDV